MKYYTMNTRGGLQESLETKKEITKEEFEKLLPMYKFYAFDKRINCSRYILKDMEKNFKDYTTWLLVDSSAAKYRIIIRGKAYAWQPLGNCSIPMIRYIAAQMNDRFKNDWQMEFNFEG